MKMQLQVPGQAGWGRGSTLSAPAPSSARASGFALLLSTSSQRNSIDKSTADSTAEEVGVRQQRIAHAIPGPGIMTGGP
jgi:hypothetical protein